METLQLFAEVEKGNISKVTLKPRSKEKDIKVKVEFGYISKEYAKELRNEIENEVNHSQFADAGLELENGSLSLDNPDYSDFMAIVKYIDDPVMGGYNTASLIFKMFEEMLRDSRYSPKQLLNWFDWIEQPIVLPKDVKPGSFQQMWMAFAADDPGIWRCPLEVQGEYLLRIMDKYTVMPLNKVVDGDLIKSREAYLKRRQNIIATCF